jgi:hypothetical protein
MQLAYSNAQGSAMFAIENISSDDQRSADRLVGFLAEHEDPGVRLRPQEAVNEALKSGLGLMIRRDGEICGCSMVYQFGDPDADNAYSEIGTMRITENGYDLQTMIARLHLVQMWLEEFHSDVHSIFAVVSEKTASEHNLVNKVKMEPWQPPPVLEYLRRQSGVEFNPEKYAIIATEDSIEAAFAKLNEAFVDDRKLTTPKGGQCVEIRMPWFSKDVLSSYQGKM